MLGPVDFIAAMRNAPTPVSIVTTNGEYGPHGATVSALCSLSAEPASILICLNKNSRILGMIEEQGIYCVNYAAQQHSELALAFAGVSAYKQQRRFSADTWTMDKETHLPVLIEAAAIFTCLHIQTVTFGSHRILIGKVERAESSLQQPLTYWDGEFRRLERL